MREAWLVSEPRLIGRLVQGLARASIPYIHGRVEDIGPELSRQVRSLECGCNLFLKHTIKGLRNPILLMLIGCGIINCDALVIAEGT
jgi:hypothetical protein